MWGVSFTGLDSCMDIIYIYIYAFCMGVHGHQARLTVFSLKFIATHPGSGMMKRGSATNKHRAVDALRLWARP